MAGRKRKRTSRLRKILYSMFVVMFLAIISISKFMLDDRLIQVKAKNEVVKTQLEDERKRTEELENLKLEIKTKKFIEETAREKFGLTYENEIVFEPEK
ncbi:MAG: septum formation initiator family protein [Catonella sp.]